MNKQDRINKLIRHCKELSKLKDRSNQKTDALQEMARLARAGLKESKEFKELERKYPINQVIDYGDVVNNIVKTVKYL